ncbi:hypothetical protein ONE63_008179 [Megalurothrips usitatus]|uniref:C2H2-type domain-containing protein n=1 Tax=Megalurothrips usitatus TaxID=439358 RepID=A0AAV7XNP3_9NEOP|nr:hypothetical protein ONE63_008179 [Megalurothrips usitatus]
MEDSLQMDLSAVSNTSLGPDLMEPPQLQLSGAGDTAVCSSDLGTGGEGRDHRQGYAPSLTEGVHPPSDGSPPLGGSGMGYCGYPDCAALQASWEAYGRHLREVHREEDLCPLCLKSRTCDHSHSVEHQFRQPWLCGLCPAEFLRLRSLLRHKRHFHRLA